MGSVVGLSAVARTEECATQRREIAGVLLVGLVPIVVKVIIFD